MLGDRRDVERLELRERFGRAGVQRARLGAQQLGIDRFAREGVAKRERVAGVVRSHFDDQLQVARSAQRGKHCHRFVAAEPGDEVRREAAPGNRCVQQHVAIAFR